MVIGRSPGNHDLAFALGATTFLTDAPDQIKRIEGVLLRLGEQSPGGAGHVDTITAPASASRWWVLYVNSSCL
jgi:hypothetical protein